MITFRICYLSLSSMMIRLITCGTFHKSLNPQDVNQNFIGDECEKGEDFDKDGFIG